METSARFLKTKPGYEKLADKAEKLGVGLYDKIRSSIERDDHTFIALCLRKGVSNMAIALLASGARKFDAHKMKDFTEMTGSEGGPAEMRFQMMSNPDAWKQNQFLFDYFDRKGYFE